MQRCRLPSHRARQPRPCPARQAGTETPTLPLAVQPRAANHRAIHVQQLAAPVCAASDHLSFENAPVVELESSASSGLPTCPRSVIRLPRPASLRHGAPSMLEVVGPFALVDTTVSIRAAPDAVSRTSHPGPGVLVGTSHDAAALAVQDVACKGAVKGSGGGGERALGAGAVDKCPDKGAAVGVGHAAVVQGVVAPQSIKRRAVGKLHGAPPAALAGSKLAVVGANVGVRCSANPVAECGLQGCGGPLTRLRGR